MLHDDLPRRRTIASLYAEKERVPQDASADRRLEPFCISPAADVALEALAAQKIGPIVLGSEVSCGAEGGLAHLDLGDALLLQLSPILQLCGPDLQDLPLPLDVDGCLLFRGNSTFRCEFGQSLQVFGKSRQRLRGCLRALPGTPCAVRAPGTLHGRHWRGVLPKLIHRHVPASPGLAIALKELHAHTFPVRFSGGQRRVVPHDRGRAGAKGGCREIIHVGARQPRGNNVWVST
mmetsp:Transcript_112977/g.292106  ORF Transcript_112977/g.292106 Transcript_112977/m.292106 type:complete len:234 (+) Transcript_112977:1358-2059(+)